LHLAKYLKKFRYKIDVRHEKVLLKIQCLACGYGEADSSEPDGGVGGEDETPILSAQETEGLKDKRD
jgi:hypothetical protein